MNGKLLKLDSSSSIIPTDNVKCIYSDNLYKLGKLPEWSPLKPSFDIDKKKS